MQATGSGCQVEATFEIGLGLVEMAEDRVQVPMGTGHGE